MLSLETGERRSLLTKASNPRYVSTGHILFARAGSVYAAPFDVTRLRVTGEAVPVLHDIRIVSGQAEFAVGSDGTLVYAKKVRSETTARWSGSIVGGKPKLSPKGGVDFGIRGFHRMAVALPLLSGNPVVRTCGFMSSTGIF